MFIRILHGSLLVFIGLFLALATLEISMWMAGFTISSYQKYKNDRALKNKSQYTVMCIGESTTANQYPIQLQEILNKTSPDKFSIIDAGIRATSLETIFKNLDTNIEKYHPNIVICMMGINNGFTSKNNEVGYLNNIKSNKTQNKIKVYKLYLLLKQHVLSFIQSEELFANNIDISNSTEHQIQKAMELYYKGQYISAEKILLKTLQNEPNNEEAYTHIIELYFYHLTEFEDTCYKMALKALNMHFFDRPLFYSVIINYNLQHGNIDKAKQFINQAVNEKNLMIHLDMYGQIKKLITTEQREKLLQKILVNKTDIGYGIHAINCIEQKDFDKAEQYFDIAEQLRLDFPNEETKKLYRLIIKKLVDNKIKVICMQYPVRSIKLLQNILKDTNYYDKITFISNELTFKQALKEKPYNEIFLDQFAGDFGHCTEYGNTLIAKKVTKKLKDLTN